MTDISPHDSHERWVLLVRDPASYRSEGPRKIVTGPKGSCTLTYEVAPLDEEYALRYSIWLAGYAGCSSPWTLFANREEAIDHLIKSSTSYFRRELFGTNSSCSERHKVGIKAMLQALEPNTLFGFQEPEPALKSEWYDDMIGKQLEIKTRELNWKLLDVVRSHNFAPISKSGSFFDIPVPK